MATAVGIFFLAVLSPVSETSSDPALALVAAQALLDHGTLDLSVYEADPRLTYTFDLRNYRVRRYEDGIYHYSLGLPILSVPFVWLANRLGVHMLDPRQEAALQNVLSALVVAGLFVLLVELGRRAAPFWVSFIAAIGTVLGSTLISTLSTALWNTGYQLLLLLLALLVVARRGGAPLQARSGGLLALLVGAAFLCRPTAAFFGVGFLVYLLSERGRWPRALAAAGLTALLALVVLGKLGLLSFLPRYYHPAKLWPAHEGPWASLSGVLFSPSRGLLVYSPFVLGVALAVVFAWHALRRDRLAWWVATWMGLHLVAVSMKGVWWGGHCFGPRLLTELMPGFALLACQAWSALEGRRRTALTIAWCALLMPSIAVHSLQGLFNDATRQWNVRPNVDAHRELLWDWRHPQLLATDRSVEARWLDFRRRELATWTPDEAVSFRDPRAVIFVDWYEPEPAWRWTRGTASAILFRLTEPDGARPYVLALHLGAHGRQSTTLRLNGVVVEQGVVEGLDPTWISVLLPPGTLRAGENRIDLETPDASPAPGDERTLALALRSLTLLSVTGTVAWNDAPYFQDGWSPAETGWRWSVGRSAGIALPIGEVDTAAPHALELEGRSLGAQRVEVVLEGTVLGTLRLIDAAPQTVRLEIPAGRLRPNAIHHVELRLPDARVSPEDARQLGVALVTLTVR